MESAYKPPQIPIYQSPDQVLPNQGGLVIPHQTTFNQVFGWVFNQYGHLFDEASADSLENAYAMRLDPAITEPLATRCRAISLIPWHVEAEDLDDENQRKHAAYNEKCVRRYLRIPELIYNLADGDFVGRSGSQMIFDWDTTGPFQRQTFQLVDHVPVDGDKLIFKWNGEVGVRVSPLFQGPRTEIGLSSAGYVHFLTPAEREVMCIHRYVRQDMPFLMGNRAGAIQGRGLRHDLYWYWSQKQLLMGLVADYIRWFAQGLIVVYYQASNPTAFDEAKARVDRQSGSPYLFWPMTDDGAKPGFKPVEVFNPSTANTNFLLDMIEGQYNTQIRRCILGQTQTTVSTPLGIGSGQPELQAETFAGVVKFSTYLMAATLTTDLLGTLYRYNSPGVPRGKWVFDIDSPNAADFIEAADWFLNRGGSIDVDTAQKELGLPPAKPGKPTLGGPMPNQPSAVGSLPEGVPVVDSGAPTGDQPPGAEQAAAGPA